MFGANGSTENLNKAHLNAQPQSRAWDASQRPGAYECQNADTGRAEIYVNISLLLTTDQREATWHEQQHTIANVAAQHKKTLQQKEKTVHKQILFFLQSNWRIGGNENHDFVVVRRVEQVRFKGFCRHRAPKHTQLDSYPQDRDPATAKHLSRTTLEATGTTWTMTQASM